MQSKIFKKSQTNEYYFEEGCYINELANSDDDLQVSVGNLLGFAGQYGPEGRVHAPDGLQRFRRADAVPMEALIRFAQP